MRLIFTLMFALCAVSAQAEITIRADSAVFGPGATSGFVDIFISSDTGDDLVLALSTDFELIDGGDFPDPPGIFGETGFFGEGALDSASFLNRDGVGVANLSLDLDPVTSPLPEERLLAQLTIDLAGLAPGVYTVAITNTFAVDGTATDIPVSVFNGSFEVSAVPEPATTALLGIGAIALCARRSRKSGEHSIV